MTVPSPHARVPRDLDPLPVLEDPQRLAAVTALGDPDVVVLDHLAAVTAATLRCDVAFVCLLDGERQRVIGGAGIEHASYGVHGALCINTLALGEPLMIGEFTGDLVAERSSVAAAGFRSYAGAPVRVRGERVGTLCGLHGRQRAWTIEDAQRLVSLAEIAGHLLATSA